MRQKGQHSHAARRCHLLGPPAGSAGTQRRAPWVHTEWFTVIPIAGWATCRVLWTLYVGGGLLVDGPTAIWSEVGRSLAARGRPRPVNSTCQSGPERPANRGRISVAIDGMVVIAMIDSLKAYHRG